MGALPAAQARLDPPRVLNTTVCDVITLVQQQRHTHSLYMTSTQRIQAHIRARPARPDARRGTRRAAAFVAIAQEKKVTHICVTALKRTCPHSQTALKKTQGSPRIARRRVEGHCSLSSTAGAALRSRPRASHLRAGMAKWARLHPGEAC